MDTKKRYRPTLMAAAGICLMVMVLSCSYDSPVRDDISLNEGWETIANDTDRFAYEGFEVPGYITDAWIHVDVPHNWDDYGGYRRLMHGNRHGYAWYRKVFRQEKEEPGKHYFLWFEGVGSYATVWLNGDSVGYHAGGRTSFTIDITDKVRFNGENILAVRADHPASIRDLPWVCGGCSPEWGFSEGSQPMGIFRSVHLIVTNSIRIEPFGVHIWNDDDISIEQAVLHISTEVKNYSTDAKKIQLLNRLVDKNGKIIVEVVSDVMLSGGQVDTIKQTFNNIENPHLWSTEDPYLYKVHTQVRESVRLTDEIVTPYGIRWTKWDIKGEGATNRFYLNGKPVFINGTCEYEHILGKGHAFSAEQIDARAEQVKAAGFNAFRDGHQPHNLRYQQKWDSLGILWWPQMSAHIWFDNPEFKVNFKKLLHDWIKERRNSPSIILWGLQNESTIPAGFAEEYTELIRKMDPGASSQRLVTTCNGGKGTDWNVIQNWSGTYGGNPDIYDKELSRQLLNGEYGAWRTIGLHTEGSFNYRGPLSEDRMWLLMESKIRLAESVRNHCCGQFHWLLCSHDNPGRIQSGEGLRDLDRLGPVNYKGTFTIWGEPLDVYYMYRANYAPKETEPMIYIVSHTWPGRWEKPGIKNDIRVFSNCDEVELFNGLRSVSFGRKTRNGIGTHFIWDSVNIQYNLLYAVGYVNGKEAATDCIVLDFLPEAPGMDKLAGKDQPLTGNDDVRNYLYRVNCGGPDYTDGQGDCWMADVHKDGPGWGSVSWTDDYEELPAFFGSQRQTHDPIKGTKDWPLLQNFRYGRHKLAYEFPVQDGDYRVELFFIEPWYGTGGGLECKGWRIFDVAVNDNVAINDLDIWKEAGHDQLLKKTIDISVSGGLLRISFPEVKAGQAVISAIAISSEDERLRPARPSKRLIEEFHLKNDDASGWSTETWLDEGDNLYTDSDVKIVFLPPDLFGCEWIKTPQYVETDKNSSLATFSFSNDADLYIGIDENVVKKPDWLGSFNKRKEIIRSTAGNGTSYSVYQKRYNKGETVELLPINTDIDAETAMYIICAVPVTKLDDPIDLRRASVYQAKEAGHEGKAGNVRYMGRECKIVPGKGDAIVWRFSVGLASKYGLEFRYMNLDSAEVTVDAEIIAADRRLVWSGQWIFLPTNTRWKSLKTDTRTTINAGEYILRLKPLEQGPFYFDWMKVQ